MGHSTILPKMDLHIGTSGWSYASWKPAFFPEKLPSKRFLEFYGTRLNAVELNATFRRMPTASAIAGWVGATPADFRFAAKVHQSITHFKRLKDADESMRFFLQSMEPMRQSGKLGPILIQTPPNLKADIGLLRTFFSVAAVAYRFAFEFRHESWFSDGGIRHLEKQECRAVLGGEREDRCAQEWPRRILFITGFASRSTASPTWSRWRKS